MIKVALAIADNRPYLDKRFAMNLLCIQEAFYKWKIKEKESEYKLITVFNSGGYAIDEMRESLADNLIKIGTDIIIWLDSDVLPSANMIERMLTCFEKFKEIEAITGLYTFKSPPFIPHIYSKYDKKTDKFDVAGGFPLKQIFEVQGAGFGCLGIKTEVFKRISRPWFDFDSNDHGEDLYFFKKFFVENVEPINIVCDPEINCGHLRQAAIDIKWYIEHNKLSVENDWIKATPEILRQIGEFHEKKNKAQVINHLKQK